MDLVSAHAFFPDAREFVLLAEFAVHSGDAACFLSRPCALSARRAALMWFKDWRSFGYAWSSTDLMRVSLAGAAGVLPALLLCSHLIGHRLLGLEPLQHQGLNGTVLHTSGGRITYISMWISSEAGKAWGWQPRPRVHLLLVEQQLRLVRSLLVSRASTYITIVKAAPHWILREPLVARWLLDLSCATLQDETGPTPGAYRADTSLNGDKRWVLSPRGRFVDFTFRERYWYPGEREPLQQLFNGSTELPFIFGYAGGGAQLRHTGNGSLLAAWRDAHPSVRARTLGAPVAGPGSIFR